MKILIGVLKLLFGLLIMAGLFYIAVRLGLHRIKGDDQISLIVVLASIIFSAIIALAIHEAGHALMARICGFRFHFYIVGPLEIMRKDDKIKFGINRNLGLYGGATASFPTDGSPANIQKMGYVTLTGPAISLLFGVLCYVGLYFADGILCLLCFCSGLMSFMTFLATTLPDKTGPFFTDRKSYQRLMTKGPARDEQMATFNITGHFLKNNSYIDVNIEDIKTLIHSEDIDIKYLGYFNLLCYEMEIDRCKNPETLEQFQLLSKAMDKSTVSANEKIISDWDTHLKSRAG